MSSFVYKGEAWSDEDPKEIIVQNIPRQTRVLDVGCGSGVLGGWLISNKQCFVEGVEYHPEAIRLAKKKLKNVYPINLENHQKLNNVQGEYDIITLVDVLEHCTNPTKILHILQSKLTSKGKFLISLPNVAHHSVRFGLLKGKFEYADSGILDRTHVAFYTKKNIEILLDNSKLRYRLLGSTIPNKGLWHYVGKIDPSLAAVQYVYEAAI